MHTNSSLEVQKYLRNGGTVESLAIDHQIEDYGNERLAYLSYGIGASFMDKMVRECRSLVLERGSWNVVAQTFEKFGNRGEGYVPELVGHVNYYDKLDGSLITIFNYIGQWFIPTRKRLYADGQMNASKDTFADLIDVTIKEQFGLTRDEFTNYLNPDFTYAFELTSPDNRILVDYPKRELSLLAVRDIKTLEEIQPYSIPLNGLQTVPVVKTVDYHNEEDLMAWLVTTSPTETEGVVAVDAEFNRMKIKSPGYVAAFRACFAGRNMTPGKIIDLIKEAKDDDIYSLLTPFNQQFLDSTRVIVREAMGKIEADWETVKDFPGTQKEFAMATKGFFWQTAAFDRRARGTTTSEFFKKTSTDKIVEKLGLKVPSIKLEDVVEENKVIAEDQ